MLRKILLPAFLLMFIFTAFYSCQKSINSEISIGQNGAISVAGRVVDEAKNPVKGATVIAGNRTATTDVNGNFKVTLTSANESAAYIKVQKEGYFLGSRTFVASARSTNNVVVELIPKTVSGTFNSNSGGSVSLTFGGRINFPATAVMNTANNTAYTGNVSVSAFLIDPTVPNLTSIMPGDLRGITTNNEETGLQSFGMMAVELTGAGGEKLQLAQGKTAAITFPIPASMQATAPATIPLWYFDEVKGLWKEEGSAVKQGGSYVGSVAHFSFWNCDAPFPTISLEAVIKDAAGNFLNDAKVTIKSTTDQGMVASAFTDDAGYIKGLVPANKVLNISVTNKCNTLVYSKDIGPFSTPTNLGSVVTTATSGATANFTGNVTNCSGAPVTNGFVSVAMNGMNYRASVTNGTYNITIPTCAAGAYTASIIGHDITANVQGTALTVNGTTGTTTATNITACGTTATQFINYTIGTTNYAFVAPADSIFAGYSLGETKIYSFNPSRNFYMNFSGSATTGSQPLGYLSIYTSNVNVVKSGSINVSVSKFGNVDDFIEGSFSGTVKDSVGTKTYPITCNFKVKRSN